MKTAPNHVPMKQFPIRGNELIIGGSTISELAQRVGRTPFYAYDSALLTQRVNSLRKSLPDDIKIHYAIKANPMPELVRHMATLVDGFDLASVGEMNVALETNMPASRISFAGPGKGDNELAGAIKAGVTINLESADEMRRATKQGEMLGITPKVAIRVNPDFELKASGMKMSGGPKQFGIDAEIVPEVLKELANLELEFMGFHIFSGSQNLKPESIIEAHQKTFELAAKLSDHAPSPVKKLNIGGGLGIPYFPGETPIDLAPISEHLAKLLPGVKSSFGEAAIIMELGRYLVGEAGIYVAKIIERKISRGHVFLITDGGLHHHLAASGNFGQVIRKNYPVTIGNKAGSNELENVSVVGPLCTPLDILANKMDLPKSNAGDLVVVFQSGAYGYTASPLNFLSHPEPEEILV